MVEGRDRTDAPEADMSVEPMLIRVREVFDALDRVLRGEDEIGEAYVFAVDVVDSLEDGTGALEDARMAGPLRELARAKAVNLELVEEIRSRLGAGKDAGTA